MIETPLCKLAYKYGTDKCPRLKHTYTPFYYQLFKDRQNSIRKVLELGIGYYKNMENVKITYDPRLKRHYHFGASLYMWRDFFPQAQIYGADKQPQTIFEDERITTYQFDERVKEDMLKLIKNIGSDIDIVVDDASHRTNDQIFACQTLMPLLNNNVTYIIEDVTRSRAIAKVLKNYKVEIPDIQRKKCGNMLMVIRHKNTKQA